MLIQACTGHENFQQGSAKSYVFVVPTDLHPGKEVHVGIAAKAQRGITLVGMPQHFPAAQGMRAETGRWTQAAYEVPEGTVLKVFAQRNGGFGTMRIMANQLLRLRNGAAYRRIGTILTGHSRATFTRAWVEGRFDLLTPEDAKDLGVVVPPHFLPSYSSVMAQRAFEIVDIEAESMAAPVVVEQVVENSDGEQVTIRRSRRNRALDL